MYMYVSLHTKIGRSGHRCKYLSSLEYGETQKKEAVLNLFNTTSR